MTVLGGNDVRRDAIRRERRERRITPSGPGPTPAQRYEWYCERQVSILLSLLPADVLRTFYGHAREWAAGRGEHQAKDPLSTLRRFGRRVLPLPPFEIWRNDFLRHRLAYLEDDLEPPDPRTRSDPVTVDARSLDYRDESWNVELRLFSDAAVWRGFMVFRSGTGPAFSTADVFCESAPAAIRERFMDFEPGTLQAFLRSALP